MWAHVKKTWNWLVLSATRLSVKKALRLISDAFHWGKSSELWLFLSPFSEPSYLDDSFSMETKESLPFGELRLKKH